MAKGKYVQYLDGDDTLLPDALENLASRAEDTAADVVAATFYFCWSEKAKEKSVCLAFDEISGIAYFKEILNERGYWSLWSHFQKRTLFYDCQLEMMPDIYLGEDSIWMTQLLFHTPKVVSLQEPILKYKFFFYILPLGYR